MLESKGLGAGAGLWGAAREDRWPVQDMKNLRSQIEAGVTARCAQAGAELSLPAPLVRGARWTARTMSWVGQVVSAERFGQFCKFCLVGVSGTGVDMLILFLLADTRMLGWSVAVSKVCAAEVALLNNFFWNECWTFRPRSTLAQRMGAAEGEEARRGFGGFVRRLVMFQAICGVGIGLSVALLHLFHAWLGFNLYFANLLTIGVVTLWNFGINARFNWTTPFQGEVREAQCASCAATFPAFLAQRTSCVADCSPEEAGVSGCVALDNPSHASPRLDQGLEGIRR